MRAASGPCVDDRGDGNIGMVPASIGDALRSDRARAVRDLGTLYQLASFCSAPRITWGRGRTLIHYGFREGMGQSMRPARFMEYLWQLHDVLDEIECNVLVDLHFRRQCGQTCPADREPRGVVLVVSRQWVPTADEFGEFLRNLPRELVPCARRIPAHGRDD